CERVEDRRVGRDGRMGLARMRRARHRPGEDEMLREPHRLVTELFGRERRVEMEIGIERPERHAEFHEPASSPAVTQLPSRALPQPPAARFPPSTWMVVPVTKRPRSEARKTTAPA